MSLNGFSNLLKNIHICSYSSQGSLLKELATSIQFASKMDIQRLLELINTTGDMDLQGKLLSILGVHLISSKANNDIAMTCNGLYNTIQNLLNRGQPSKTTAVLNFLCALLYVEDEEEKLSRRKALVTYSKNMLRVSGCLAALTNLFCNTMMNQDTWKSLCLGLAEVCNGCLANQTYCSHLIPICVQKCCQGNVDAFIVLKSLLHNHENNMDIFLQTNGFSVFTREMLQYDTCMQLLNILVQNCPKSIMNLRETDLVQNLYELTQYGPQTQIGQWAKIILYHIEPKIKDNIKEVTKLEKTNNLSKLNFNNATFISNVKPASDETTNLLENVMKEVLNWKSKYGNTNEQFRPNNNVSVCRPQYVRKQQSFINTNFRNVQPRARCSTQHPKKVYEQSTTHMSKDLSFSFLINKDVYKNSSSIDGQDNENLATINKMERTRLSNKRSILDLEEFKPTFISTPKCNKTMNRKKKALSQSSKITKYFSHKKEYKRPNKTYRAIHTKDASTEIRRKSMSSRFFDAVNESCTTVVKTFKNIFISKNKSMENDQTKLSPKDSNSCSYSFTNYMKKRDAIMENDDIINENIPNKNRTEQESCRTCDDTLILKRKLADDEHLKQTLKKLKLGINVYGCDFKKIAKAFWPHDSYMNSVVLYQLYRKLILK